MSRSRRKHKAPFVEPPWCGTPETCTPQKRCECEFKPHPLYREVGSWVEFKYPADLAGWKKGDIVKDTFKAEITKRHDGSCCKTNCVDATYDVECPASADYPAGWYIQNLDSKEADNPNDIAERVLTPCDPPVLQPPPQAAKEEEEEEGNTSSGDVRRRVKKRRTAGGVDGASGTGDASDDSDHVTGWFECEFNCGYEYKDQAIVEVHERSCQINPKNKEAAAAAAARIAATGADAVDGGGDGDSDCIYPAPNVGWKGLKEHALRQKLHQIPCAVSAENAGRGKRAKAFKGVGKVLRTQDATVNHFTFSLSQKAFRNYKMLLDTLDAKDFKKVGGVDADPVKAGSKLDRATTSDEEAAEEEAGVAGEGGAGSGATASPKKGKRKYFNGGRKKAGSKRNQKRKPVVSTDDGGPTTKPGGKSRPSKFKLGDGNEDETPLELSHEDRWLDSINYESMDEETEDTVRARAEELLKECKPRGDGMNDNGPHLYNDKTGTMLVLDQISDGAYQTAQYAEPNLYKPRIQSQKEIDDDEAVEAVYREVAEQINSQMPDLIDSHGIETKGGSAVIVYKPGMGTGKVHFDYERGQAALVVVCVESPPRDRMHICKDCEGMQSGRTLINVSADGMNAPYDMPAGEYCHPMPVALKPGEVLVVRNFDPDTHEMLKIGWHTGEAVLCGTKRILSIGIYRMDRVNHYDRKAQWEYMPGVSADAIACGWPKTHLAVKQRAASKEMAWTTDEVTHTRMRTRAFGTLQGYENATGRRRVALKDFVSARRGGNGLFVSPGRAAAAEKAAASRKEKEDKKAKKDSWFECEFNCGYEYNNQRVVEVHERSCIKNPENQRFYASRGNGTAIAAGGAVMPGAMPFGMGGVSFNPYGAGGGMYQNSYSGGPVGGGGPAGGGGGASGARGHASAIAADPLDKPERVFQIKLKNLKLMQFNGLVGISDGVKTEGRYLAQVEIDGVMKKVSVQKQNMQFIREIPQAEADAMLKSRSQAAPMQMAVPQAQVEVQAQAQAQQMIQPAFLGAQQQLMQQFAQQQQTLINSFPQAGFQGYTQHAQQFPQVSLKQFELLQAQQRLSSAQMGMQMGFMPQTIPGMPPYANFPLNQTQQIGGAAMPNSNTGAGSAVAGAAGSGAGAAGADAGAGAGRGTDSVTGNSQDLGAADDANAGIATEYAFDASMDDEAAPGAIEAVVKSAAANAEQFVEQGKSGNHQCGWCGVSFARSDGLVRHFKRCKKMPGGCNHYAELAYKLTLDKLRGIATGQEVKDGFKCAKCDLVFARNDGLSRHLGLSGSRANSCTGVATTVKKVGLTNLSEVEQKALAEVEKMLEQRKGPAL